MINPEKHPIKYPDKTAFKKALRADSVKEEFIVPFEIGGFLPENVIGNAPLHVTLINVEDVTDSAGSVDGFVVCAGRVNHCSNRTAPLRGSLE